MLQKDGFFRKQRDDKRDDNMFQTKPVTPSPAPAANAEVAPVVQNTPVETPREARSDERKEARLVVGPDIKMRGAEISDCDTLVVEGRMEATLDSRVLEIAEHGVFQGTIAVDHATIHGRFEGELTVRKQLVIEGTGKVSGKIRYAKIRIQEGAELAGEVALLDKASISAARKAA